MTGAIFFETLRRSWRQPLYWGAGLMIWALYPFFMIPNNEQGLDQYVELLDDLPEGLLAAVGINGAESLSTPEGFVGYAFFGYILLILSVFAVIAGLNVSANEEEQGIMDMQLSLPVARWRVITEKLLAYSFMLVVIALLGFIGLLIGDAVAPVEIDLSVGRYLEGALNILPGALAILTLTAFLGAVLRRRSTAMAVAGVYVVVAYLLDAVANAANSDFMDALRQFSVFSHYEGTTVLQTGLDAGNVVLLLAFALVLGVGANWFFQRRDIAV